MVNYIGVVAKVISESLLSLYPSLVKNLNLSLGVQLWSRFFIYICLALFFVNWDFISKTLFSKNGILLSFITIAHVFTSYRGFQLLESGISYVLFYTYPLMILLLAGEPIEWIMGFAIIGVYLLVTDNSNNHNNQVKDETKSSQKDQDQDQTKTTPIPYFWNEGLIMILLAAFTEALIYFVVKNIKTENNWNHLFISYYLGAIILTLYYTYTSFYSPPKDGQEPFTLENTTWNFQLVISLLLNIIIGLFGYLLRFFSINKLNAKTYAFLSYIGIIMAFVYGVIFNNDIITINKIIGSVFVLIPVIYAKEHLIKVIDPFMGS